ncbi:FAD-dependent oxidoreductase [Paenibacillus sp. HWE-109]|uniref:FAD-dependent oxidoreductase n=1 Tax=Paenibacillus sp. HWE-109 TaxID=1306526 RepID=UPI001EDD8B6D|nr:FAD-dependent oxidoreductase [Paenibacillus sp. HWE-109]UKS28569.1 FAD-dependent oxidoreductase [Paenibacillus sp. HWE-109]
MNQYTFQKNVAVYEKADILVVGGGPAGVAAAIAAARCGKKVALLEQSGQLGGMGTLGNVSVFMGVGNVTGIYREIISEVLPQQAVPDDHKGSIWPQYNPFRLRHYLNEKLEKEGVQVLFHVSFAGTVTEGGRVKAVIANSREGLLAFEADVFIDCTGDGRVAIEAGADYTTGRDVDGLTQPMTLMFMMQNTGQPAVRQLPEGCYRYENIAELPQGRLLHWEQNEPGNLLVNMTRVKGNGANVKDVSYAEKEAVRQAFSVADFLQRNGFENYVISHLPGQVGVRETNQIVGHYTLTEDDILSSRRFDDVVAQTNYEIDIHNPDGKAGTDEREVKGYDIPYRCLIPQGVEGLLVAGRSISATHVAMSSMRVQATCFALGQAAGVAASIAVNQGIPLERVSADELHEALGLQNVLFLKNTHK